MPLVENKLGQFSMEAHWAVAGKLAPPPQHVTTAPRTALLDRLDRASRLPLTVVLSPPGFGKTTLLSQWYHRLRDDGETAVAWLSVDEEDGELSRFLTGLALALGRAGIELGPLLQTVKSSQNERDTQAVTNALLALIQRTARRLVLILDDYDRGNNPNIDETVMRLLQHGGPRLHLLLATRTSPALALSRWSVHGCVERIGANDLALDDAEAQAVLGAHVPLQAVQRLQRHTEGWAVALQLASLWISGDERRLEDVEKFRGRSGEIAAYLAEQVVQDLHEPLRTFLLKTSVLDRFNADLADTLRERRDSDLLLSRLNHFHGLLVPLDAEHEWFRYHPLFADYLRRQLRQQAPDRLPILHRRAAIWFAKHDHLLEAVRHATDAGDTELAAGFFAANGNWELMLRHGLAYVRLLLRHFDYKTIRDTPALNLTQAYLHMKLGEFAHARLLLERFRAFSVEERELFGRDYTIVIALLRDLLDEICPDPNGAARIAAQAAALDSCDGIGRGTLLCISATTALGRGDFATAERYALQAQQAMLQADSTVGAHYALTHLGQSQYYRGQLGLADATYRQVLAMAEQHSGVERTLQSAAVCLLAQLQCERGRYDEAAVELEPALAFLEQHDGWLDIFASAYETALALARRDDRTAQTALVLMDRVEAIARARHLSRLLDLATAWRLDVLLDLPPSPGIDLLVANTGCEAHFAHALQHGHGWRHSSALGFALARWHQSAGRSQTALNLLRTVETTCQDIGNPPHLARARVRIAFILQQRGEADEAVACLGQALDYIATTQSWQAVLELGVPAKALLRLALQRDPQAAAGTTRCLAIQTLLEKLRDHQHDAVSLFSEREVEVLSELGRGSSNKQIARLLNLSENTVKFHLKNIYRKLGVESRQAARTLALQRGLAASAVPPLGG
ncbi:LuxR C-terminal-related transcriptional regulator [Pseudoxanthomonas sp. UTMC 1351]|uniref:LuxR C-terminal-related transcriptional regulator n=1 Tax=Pseudoxanthomonas sp. UTMC 1351 TaxID=2695853 RepID=UPI0034CD6579